MNVITFIGEIIAIVVPTAGFLWWLLTHVFKLGQIKEHLELSEKNTEKNFNKIESSIDQTNAKLDKLNEEVKNHSYTLIAINSFFDNKYPKNEIGSYMKKSPRKLSPTGDKILDVVNGTQFLNDNKEQLFKIIDSYHPKTKLDVQNNAMTALLYYTTTDAFNHIKDIVYDLPEMDTSEGKYELTLNDVCFVLSIPLRDMYIEERHIQ